MTDKQIIIDGICVSNCEHYDEVCLGNHHYKWCKDNDNCYYKQLKRAMNQIVELNKKVEAKEQECEELKESNIGLIKDWEEKKNQAYEIACKNNKLKEQLDQLKAENDELKVMFKDLSYENQKFSYQIEEQTKQLEPFKVEYFKGLETIVIAELAKKSIRITAENRKLEQTLTEIKEIAEGVKGYDPLAKQILQKISECEGNDD